MANSGDDWTDAENSAVVGAYFDMLADELAARPFNKSEINRVLRDGALSARSRGSVEFKLQNISAALDDEGLPWIEGYKPRGHAQGTLKDRVLKEAQRRRVSPAVPTADEEQVASRSQALLKKGLTVPPEGQQQPERVMRSTSSFKRDPSLRAWVEQKAGGLCELCGAPAPFSRADGTPYLEVHHPWRLADGGPDRFENAVALCPNCHRRLHHSATAETDLAALRLRVSRLIHPARST